MDAVSYSHADKQKQRIEKFNANPDSNSGIVTVPKTIGAGESVTVPAGRVAVLPNIQVDGEYNLPEPSISLSRALPCQSCCSIHVLKLENVNHSSQTEHPMYVGLLLLNCSL